MLENTSVIARLMQIREEIDGMIETLSDRPQFKTDIDMKRIVRVVSAQTKIPVDQIMGDSRVAPIVAARQEAIRAVHATGRYSLSQIGRFFGRDRRTIRQAIEKRKFSTELITGERETCGETDL